MKASTLPEDEWATLMRASLQGDAIAYRRLLQALLPFMRKVVAHATSRYGYGMEDVEDVVQETMISIHLKRHTWESSAPLVPWIRAIARHKLIDTLRKKGHRIQVPLEPLEDILPDHQGAQATEQAMVLKDASRLMQHLKGKQADVVRAISLDGESIQDVAKRLCMSEGAVRVTLHRGITALATYARGV